MAKKKTSLNAVSRSAKRMRTSRSKNLMEVEPGFDSQGTSEQADGRESLEMAHIESGSREGTSGTGERLPRETVWDNTQRVGTQDYVDEGQAIRDARLARDRARKATAKERETPAERESRLRRNSACHINLRWRESQNVRKARLDDDSQRHYLSRQNETEGVRKERLAVDRLRHCMSREDETEGMRKERLAINRLRHETLRAKETDEDREERRRRNRDSYILLSETKKSRLEREQDKVKFLRSNETEEERASRATGDNVRHEIMRGLETDSDRQGRLAGERERHVRRSMREWRGIAKSGFSYDPVSDYSEVAAIGAMDITCFHCKALRWKSEPKGICCSSGKVTLPPFCAPPEPIRSLIDGKHAKSQNFFRYIRSYNSCFQMTSFGANQVSEGGFMPTFKVQGQVYHLIGSLMPSNSKIIPSFLQIYFIADVKEQATLRQNIFDDLDIELIEDIQAMLHQHNTYVQSFKTALETISSGSEEYKVVIKADRMPRGEHVGRFNAPAVNEVAVVLVGDPSDKRDIVLRMRSDNLSKISETHRSYDALQYPIMHCHGEDGYHFMNYHKNPATGEYSNKKISASEFYSYRLMVRQDDHNFFHHYRQLMNQFLVDMYAKIESERLLYIRTHQQQLRAENYIHLQDALRQETRIEDLGRVVILPSSFTGSPRYMHSRTQDAFCYVRKYGRPDLFITMTTNCNWAEIKKELITGQTPQDRHDVVSRVFHLKLRCMMALLNRGGLFGTPNCYIYTVEWQKRGLPHAHILLWLEDPIRPGQVDSVIRAELPNPENDPELFEIVKKHMLHGPCGELNRQSPCMKDGRCSKNYPKYFLDNTMTGDDGYPKYRRRSPENGGFRTSLRKGNDLVTMDNRWVVPYCPVLLRMFKTHINVEYCSSVKGIKYVCKYINKGSDGITIAIQNEHDEVQRYHSGRYISTSEAVWRILSFPIHERYPPVIHLDVHLENGQRVYFQPDNVRDSRKP